RIATVQPNFYYMFSGATDDAAAAPGGDGAAAAQANQGATPAQAHEGAIPAQANPGANPAQANQGAAPAATPAATPVGDPLQYVVEKMHLAQAHQLARGNRVLIAVIDSAIDTQHAELQGAVVGGLDTVKGTVQPDKHGTAMAG